LKARLSLLLDAIHERSPHGRILVVNYLTILPPAGTCARLGLTAAQADDGRRIAGALAAITATAAQTHGAELVDVALASQSHDVCASVPWVQGFIAGDGGGVAFHPNIVGTHAVADRLLLALSRPTRL
jgi:hypothetical protein